MKRLPIMILLALTGSFLAFRSIGNNSYKSLPPGKYEQILRLVAEIMSQAHFSPQQIDDAFSQKVFKKFIADLDPEKNFFLESDMDSLKMKFENKIDDELRGAPVEFFLAASKRFNPRMEEVASLYAELLSKPFDFSISEEVVLDGEKLAFSNTKEERLERWRKKLKYLVLDKYTESLDIRDKSKGKSGFVAKSDADLEKEAREKIKRLMDRTFERFRFKFSEDDKFNLFVNDITTTMDPHSQFFPPVDKRYFDEEMSGHFSGIGASLQYDDGNIKIASVLTGSPAAKSGEIAVGDVIQKVAQANEDPVDLIGFIVTDAVKLIRGKKGTEVKLTLKKLDGAMKIVKLIRDEIVQDETFARSAVVKNGTEKIGYIYLPEFYADFDNPKGARSYVDVAKEVAKLKEEKVDGIVIDLRNNGGGSLYDVVQMAGLFIDNGPIVQVKERENNASVLKDKDGAVLYSGPLAVMVNEFSASASEIFAAAIQDYGRGVVIGSTTTYGKGTVQRNIGLDPVNGFSMSNADLGTVKLTLQKFYRINGGSTQLKGVASDIVLPDQYENLKLREKDDTDALPWDEIKNVTYAGWSYGYDLNVIRQLGAQRVQADARFKLIKDNVNWLNKQNDKTYSLKLDEFRKEQRMIRDTFSQLDSLIKLKDGLNVVSVTGEENRWAEDKNKQDRFKLWLKNLSTDIYLDQAVKVMNDMVNQQNIAKAKIATTQEPVKKAF